MCISTHTTKNTWHIDVKDTQMYNCIWYFCIYLHGLSLNGWHAVFCITNNRHDRTITTHAIKRHFLIWMTPVRQPTERRCSCVLTLKYTFICVYWWTRQRIHNTLIVVDRYLRLMGDKTIPDSAEPRLESFYPPFVAGIDLPHQDVVDSSNPWHGIPILVRWHIYILRRPHPLVYTPSNILGISWLMMRRRLVSPVIKNITIDVQAKQALVFREQWSKLY